MKIKSIVILLTCWLLLSGLTVPAIACCEEDPPGDPSCYVCEDGAWVLEDWAQCGQDSDCPDCYSCENCYCDWDCTTGQCCDNDDCVECPDCDDCESCNTANCECECKAGSECDCPGKSCSGCCECESCSCADKNDNCTGECHNGCSGCSCVDDDSKCSSIDCETCNEGVCEDECPALGKHCWLGTCVECRDVLDCELCYECKLHKCVHPCDECYYPKYCGYACACVECYYGEEDTTTCSTANSTTECDCSINIFSPCSSTEESVVYSGNSLKSCTGPDCDPVDVLCYTTYQECKTSGSYQPLKWCGGDLLPPTCVIDVMNPGPGCWTCVNSYESGVPTYESQGDCPTEAWPE